MNCTLCDGQRFDLRKRTIANGGVQFVQQCLTCGRAGSQPVSRAKLGRQGDRLLPFDETLQKVWEQMGSAKRAAEKQAEREAWFKEHDAYLKTEDWWIRRAAVMERAKGLCEGCRSQRASQVHHLTYEHWKDEFLWELVAICDDCHERVHGKESTTP